MLFKQDVLDRIAKGEVTLAFRRWRRPTVRPGGRLRTPIGELAIEDVLIVAPDAITEADARSAGYRDCPALLAALGDREGEVYRIAFRIAGPDPRIALRAADDIGDDELDAIAARLARLDRGLLGEWTRVVLQLIAANPARRAPDLAAMRQLDTARFKRMVRQLKELGLIESLDVGYRLSPRGARVLSRLQAG